MDLMVLSVFKNSESKTSCGETDLQHYSGVSLNQPVGIIDNPLDDSIPQYFWHMLFFNTSVKNERLDRVPLHDFSRQPQILSSP